jgi:protein-tyrosine phosphatase
MKATAYWIEGPWHGRLAIVPRPRGGDWLEDEVRAWRAAEIDVIVSLLQSEEDSELDIVQEADLCQSNGVECVGFPVADRGVPESAAFFAEFVLWLERKLKAGKTVAVHCRQGVGRSAILAASLLAASGLDVDTAWGRVSKARGCPVPDTTEQREWVARLARDFLTPSVTEQ